MTTTMFANSVNKNSVNKNNLLLWQLINSSRARENKAVCTNKYSKMRNWRCSL